jgi:hypothetical protein
VRVAAVHAPDAATIATRARGRRCPRRTLAALAVSLSVGSAVDAEPLPRVEHVTRALAAVRGLGPDGRDRLDRELYATARTQCRADTGTPAASCLIAAARAACAADPDRGRCEAAADVVVTNLRAAPAWVDEPTRIRLVRSSTDYRAALAAELRRRHAALAAELVLGPAGPTGRGDAVAIDQLCVQRDRALHACQPGDAACVPSLPWSRCVAALVWFVGSSP